MLGRVVVVPGLVVAIFFAIAFVAVFFGGCAPLEPGMLGATPGDLVASTDDAKTVPGQYIVTLADGVDASRFDAAHFGVRLVRALPRQNAVVVGGVADDAKVREIAGDHDVVDVEPDAVARIQSAQVAPMGIVRTGARAVQDGGDNVAVCVVDTGIDYRLPDLIDRYVGGHDFVHDDDDPLDDHGHGTHVAGIIAADDDSQGVVGMAPRALLIAEKALTSKGSGSYSNIIAALNACVDEGASVINLSLGGDSSDPTLRAAIRHAYDEGVVVVVAAGNDGANLDDEPHYPASWSDLVVTVSAAAVTSPAASSSVKYPVFSNYGSAVALSAPGVGVISDRAGGGTISLSGTSMAAPHVAGAAAVFLGQHPLSSPDAVKAALVAHAEDVNHVSIHPEKFLDVRAF